METTKKTGRRGISIKQKLMLFVALICITLISLVWLTLSVILEPAYTWMVKSDLDKELTLIDGIVDQYGLMSQDSTGFVEQSATLIGALIEDGQCLEVSSADTLMFIGGRDRIANCCLHNIKTNTVWGEAAELNGVTVLALRNYVAKNGTVSTVIHASDGREQYVVGKLIPEENVILLLSASMERVGQAAEAVKRMLLWVSAVLLPLSLLAAHLFSRWFTRPLTTLSDAAREVARGNYDISVPVTSADELGMLSSDFNAMTREVARTDQLQKDLMANVSHDLRTPLTLVRGYAETIRDLSGDDKRKRDEQLNIIISETDRLSALVNSVMELSKLSSGTEKVNAVQFDMNDFCEEIAERYEDTCRKNGYTLRLETPGSRMVSADPEMMQRVLHNLIANALSHIGPDNTVVLSLSDCADGLRVDVIDHGAGIPPEDLKQIFERYYRARQSNGKPGTGLGLSIVRAILVSHNFPFGVNSTVGEGSDFWFVMKTPAVPGAPKKEQKREGRSAEGDRSGRKEKRRGRKQLHGSVPEPAAEKEKSAAGGPAEGTVQPDAAARPAEGTLPAREVSGAAGGQLQSTSEAPAGCDSGKPPAEESGPKE